MITLLLRLGMKQKKEEEFFNPPWADEST